MAAIIARGITLPQTVYSGNTASSPRKSVKHQLKSTNIKQIKRTFQLSGSAHNIKHLVRGRVSQKCVRHGCRAQAPMDGISAASEKHVPVPKAEKDTEFSIAIAGKGTRHSVFTKRRLKKIDMRYIIKTAI
ncbi:MAG: hypothetical protein COA96_07925 [SAR86 cluster bacterium]|uniref:Uncharacterized protein n=1 Tax=SAR86 cluster bacterium TaxID=2030880 RepID=A0A2A5B1H8_9GAMM|nr:MAG: hypothetical protein COA96_07925 [SAR86 cluster bacterium]